MPGTQPKLHSYMTSDHADGGDYNVVRIWGLDEHKNVWLLDSFREKSPIREAMGLSTDEQGRFAVAERGALAMIRKWRPLVWFAEPDPKLKAIEPMIRDAMRITGVSCRLEPAPNFHHSKEEKATALAAMCEMSRVYLPSSAMGAEAIREWITFPYGTDDDQVDADGILPRVIQQAHAAVIPPAPEQKKEADYS